MNLHFDSERIKALRDRLGFTQQQLADGIGVTQPSVAQWETGRSQPTGAAVLESLIRLEGEMEKEAAV
ncbi:hypothetical protein LCGC14_1134490 [marine sediment metagenome]|uniref:HTH cro/C1-type domain-containing protein n=1 Tax=marine sediment metagenome TaxID=412755 RepID=A0A0F9MN30_9ZZZZ